MLSVASFVADGAVQSSGGHRSHDYRRTPRGIPRAPAEEFGDAGRSTSGSRLSYRHVRQMACFESRGARSARKTASLVASLRVPIRICSIGTITRATGVLK